MPAPDPAGLHVREEGEGPDVLVLLHGFGDHSCAFRHVIGPLARAGWRVLAPDLPGAGRSPKRAPGFSLDHQAAALERVLEDRAIARAVFVGHSLGAGLAIRMRATRAARVRGLVLVCGGFYRYRRPFWHRVLETPVAGEALGLFRGPWLVRRLAGEESLALGRLPDAWVEEHFLPIRDRAGWRALLRTIRACGSPEAMRASEKALLSMVPCPLLYVWGERDAFLPLDDARPFLEAQIERAVTAGHPGALATLPDAGHAPHEERPREFLAAIHSFLESLRAAPAAPRPRDTPVAPARGARRSP